MELYLTVTILILVDGFLQFTPEEVENLYKHGHNPYFSRWFSAIPNGTYTSASKLKSQSLF